jgi:BON domain
MESKWQFSDGLTLVCVTAALLFFARGALAETTSFCDNKCGDTQKCQYSCCHITTKKIAGIDYVTNVNCSHSKCCAHDEGSRAGAGAVLTIPGTRLDPITGKIKGALVASQEVDASGIACGVDTKAKIVTLDGTVPSETQKIRAAAIAKMEAQGYKVVDNLKVASEKAPKKE